jgi:hypothetical protein
MEKRASSRVGCSIEASLTYGGKAFLGRIDNLSLGGALLSTSASPIKGDEITVSFSHALEDQILVVHCTAQVVRAEPSGPGIQFVAMDAASLEDLRDIVAAHSAEPKKIHEEYRLRIEGAPAGAA